MAVVFAMMMSYLLSRTLVPTMVHFLLRPEVEIYAHGEEGLEHAQGLHLANAPCLQRQFENMRSRYAGRSAGACIIADESADRLRRIRRCVSGAGVGRRQDFFPYVDSGQMRLHVRAPEGTRIEETERIFADVEDDDPRDAAARRNRTTILDNIGLPTSGINLAFGDSRHHRQRRRRDSDLAEPETAPPHAVSTSANFAPRCARGFPMRRSSSSAANITNQILNFGLPAPIDIQVVGRDAEANYKIAQDIERKVSLVPGAVDVHIHQEVSTPAIRFNVDRSKADQAGLTQRDVANSMLISLSSSGQIAPNQWLNPQNGVNYNVAVQTPQYRLSIRSTLCAVRPITARWQAAARNCSTISLSGVHRGLTHLADRTTTTCSRSSIFSPIPICAIWAASPRISRRSSTSETQASAERHHHRGARPGGDHAVLVPPARPRLVFAILLVYLLMVVNFQSWLDPFIILTALPGRVRRHSLDVVRHADHP